MAKHCDNKNDLIRTLRRGQNAQKITDTAIDATYYAQSIIALFVLCEYVKLSDEQLQQYYEKVNEVLVKFQKGKISQKYMKGKLLEYGIDFDKVHLHE